MIAAKFQTFLILLTVLAG
ncbi:hypothetical protein, partial [Bradyrhizobium sacchari]